MALLEIRQVSRYFGSFAALDSVSLSIEAGEFFTLLGPSGCGKTTLLRLIAGFDPPAHGRILLDGQDLGQIPPEKRPVHTIFQSYALFPHLSVAKNIAFPLEMARLPKPEIERRVHEALEMVHLEALAAQRPNELSGGQKQRVAIARALVNRPRLLLLDEPMAALDLKLSEKLQIELINLQKQIGITFIYVTHNQGEALSLSRRIAVMNRGHIIQVGEPAVLYEWPASRFVADFIGTCNLLNARVTGQTGGSIDLEVEGLGTVKVAALQPVTAGQPGAFALRPEKMRMGRDFAPVDRENRFFGTIQDHLYQGDVTLYRIKMDGGAVMEALLPNAGTGAVHQYARGESIQVAWPFDVGQLLMESGPP